jgi:hypothetical protein
MRECRCGAWLAEPYDAGAQIRLASDGRAQYRAARYCALSRLPPVGPRQGSTATAAQFKKLSASDAPVLGRHHAGAS